MKKTCIVISGPTAVGKTALAILVAQHFSTQIISSDSRQCYKELTIGVAKPAADELAAVTHYFINSHSIHESVNAAIFEKYALEKVKEIFLTNDVAVVVGGTGLYIKTFCSGIDAVPVISPGIREDIISKYEIGGLEWLQKEVKKNDPIYFSKGEILNPHRLIRALEVVTSTGKSISEFQTQKNQTRDFTILKIGLELPRELLYQRISSRVDQMMQQGLVEEVRGLIAHQELNALQTVGYRELFDHFAGNISLLQAIEAIKMSTRQYAKRQMTWFKKDETISWAAPNFSRVVKLIANNI
jgi:tRNA dimethylallyltransferase